MSGDLAQGHFGSAGKDAGLGFVDIYEDVKTTNDDVLTLLPRLELTDAAKGHSTDPAIAANQVLHSNTFLHDGVLSDTFFRHDKNANVSDCANAWDMGQVLEADAVTGDMHKFDQDQKGADKYLQFAEKQFNWVDQNLKSDNGLYGDHINSDGSIDSTQYSYNQGLMLGDATMLYQVTGDSKYLDKAKDIADKSIENFQQNGTFSKQLTHFNAVFFKNLMLLDTVLKSTPGHESNPAYRQALAGYAQYVKREIDPSTRVITTSDGHDNGASGSTALDQASAVQILELAQAYPPA